MKNGLKIIFEHYKSKEYWYLKYITWGIIIIVCLAITAQIFRKIGFYPAQLIFEFFDDWATILSAAVMLLLAGAAFWTIMDNRYARIVNRNERLLNEIIEWAVEIGKYIAETTTADYFGESELKIDKAARLEKSVKMYEIALLTSESVKNIANGFGDSLTSHVNSVVENIKELKKATIIYIDKINDTNITYSQMYLHWSSELGKSIKTLIEETTKIKIKV